MEPTLRLGEYFLADATYYRSRYPSRGEVAVYTHPKQPQIHYIKRIVAVEGDRIALKGGRAIVNGMAVEEPYVDVGPAEGRFANLQERRVPVGHVYMLGDNRAHSVDSRDGVGARSGSGRQSDRTRDRYRDFASSGPHGPLGRNPEQSLNRTGALPPPA